MNSNHLRQAALVLAIFATGCVVQSGLPPQVTQEAIRQLALGMSLEEVEALLGPPVRVEAYDGQCDAKPARVTRLIYFDRPALAAFVRYPQLRVFLCGARVISVAARVGDPLDDEDVFWLRSDLSWETDEFRELFPSRR